MRAEILAWSIPLAFWLSGLSFLVLSRFGFESRRWSLAFTLMGTGYAVTIFELPAWPIAKPLAEDLLFLIASATTAHALSHRFSTFSRWRTHFSIIVTAMVLAAIGLIAYQSVRLETAAVQLGCTLLVCATLATKRWSALSLGDKLLFSTFSFICAILLLQCAVYLSMPDTGRDIEAWRASTSGFMFQLTGGVIGVGLTSAILLALSLDVIERLHRVAVTDALTGILNRRGFEEACRRMSKDLRGDAQLALIMVDLDHFKKINDTYGHETGDVVIARMANLLAKKAGVNGYAGRLGGEEFAVVLPARDLSTSMSRANDIRQAFAGIPWPFEGDWASPTASFGVTTMGRDEPYATSIARADALLYLAKRAGRDCVMVGDAETAALRAA